MSNTLGSGASSNSTGAEMSDAFGSGFASALLQVVIDRLVKFIENELHMILNVCNALRELETAMKEAWNRLNKVDYLYADKALLVQVQEVTSLCYDANDLIDDMEREIKRKKSEIKSTNPARHAIQSVQNLLKPRKISKLLSKMDKITKDLQKNQDLSSALVPTFTSHHDFPFHHKIKQKQKLFGRDEDLPAIVKELTSLNNSNFKGVSIVGMNAVGKTALANDVLNDEKVRATFPFILWASMSGKSFGYNDMIDTLTVVPHHKNSARNCCSPADLLNSDQWLILLDDLMEVPTMAWRDFQCYYLTNNGRKLLITTVNHEVAKDTDTVVHHLKPLSHEYCEELITYESTLMPNSCAIPCHVKDTLAKKSCGLPLVAIFLTRNYGKDHFSVPEDLWTMPTFRKEIIPILRSTTHNLEPHLKRCFVYFSLFPQNYHFNEEDLTLIWLGEGLVDTIQVETLSFFKNLLKWSILQPLPASNSGLIEYKMHEFIHYLAKVAGSKTYVRWDDGLFKSCEWNANTCHLSFSCNIASQFWNEVKYLKCLRTFLSLHDGQIGQIGKIPRTFFTEKSRLRVLVLKNTDITELPDSIDKLRYLRHLDISHTPVQKLPETLSKLYNLQIFKFKKERGYLQYLPQNFSDLTDLVFIDWEINDMKLLKSMPSNIGKLSNLQKLPLFLVGNDDGHRITELKHMNNLQGSICIANLNMVESEAEAKKAMLCNKSSLRRLELEWTNSRNNRNSEDVLKGLEPHVDLKELYISRYKAQIFPQWLSKSLPMLEKLHLVGCNCRHLPALEQLPALKSLYLEDMCNVIVLDLCFRGATGGTVGCFPSLESLMISDMPDLEEWGELEANDMPLLCQFKITDCPSLKILPSLKSVTSLNDLKIESCQVLRSLPDLPASLKSLSITDSDLVKARCENGGEDWSKVDCIERVQIDGTEIPTSAAQRADSSISEPETSYLQGFRSMINGVTTQFGRLF